MFQFRRDSVRLFYKIAPLKYLRCFFKTMDVEEDFINYSDQKLRDLIRDKKDASLGIATYLQNVKYPPVKDFKKGLEWFNVSESLSFAKHLKGKIVVLDFFTYCCINCMHILPDLKEVEKEFSIEDGLVVIGVHSAKFENEKQSSNILSAVQRYNIAHPVVNDYDSDMWRNCDVHCWPTLLILGPNGNPLVMLTGEGHKADLLLYIKHALDFYKKQKLISNHKLPIKSAFHLLSSIKGPLLFPGKITSISNGKADKLAVSDSGNHRIVILNEKGAILKAIGGSKVGFKDGNLTEAEFNNPQGLVFFNENILYVADTDNHAIRKIDLKGNKVETVAGNGEQGHDRVGGNLFKDQAISSPWDVAIYQTTNCDNSSEDLKNILIIAMAGTHQIWALFLDDTVWWKNKKIAAGTCMNIAGSGREENRNNQYPHAAAFAQPSGLALCKRKKEVYIADSESSSVRRLSMVDGKVTPVVGGDRNPNNLFAFGDKDGTLFEAKLQHSLGLALSQDGNTLYVADTYNHKLKKVDVEKNAVTTFSTSQNSDTTDNASGASFSEPAGMCVSSDGAKLYVADTNNHLIKVVNLESEDIQNLAVTISDRSSYKTLQVKPVSISPDGCNVQLRFNLNFKNGLKLNKESPQEWSVQVPNPAWVCERKFSNQVDKDVVIDVAIPENEENDRIEVVFNLVTCTDETCLQKSFIVEVPFDINKSGQKGDREVVFEISLDPQDVKIN